MDKFNERRRMDLCKWKMYLEKCTKKYIVWWQTRNGTSTFNCYIAFILYIYFIWHFFVCYFYLSSIFVCSHRDLVVDCQNLDLEGTIILAECLMKFGTLKRNQNRVVCIKETVVNLDHANLVIVVCFYMKVTMKMAAKTIKMVVVKTKVVPKKMNLC